LDPEIQVTGQACPIWVPLVENFEYDSPGADYFVEKRISEIMDRDPEIDTLILGCTHYPLLLHKIEKYVPQGVKIVSQGEYVSEKLADYLLRHPEMEQRLSKGGRVQYLTTESADKFRESARLFMNDTELSAERISLPFTEK
jgi:glutamate racemase